MNVYLCMSILGMHESPFIYVFTYVLLYISIFVCICVSKYENQEAPHHVGNQEVKHVTIYSKETQ